MAFKESRGRYRVVNDLGYMGKYQFGTSTLKSLRIKDTLNFLNNSKIQEKAFRASIARNKYLLQQEIEKFNGKEISGIKITESGILAAAHLAGAGNVKKFLYSNGRRSSKDAFGTKIEKYFREFADYDLSLIEPTLNPKM